MEVFDWLLYDFNQFNRRAFSKADSCNKTEQTIKEESKGKPKVWDSGSGQIMVTCDKHVTGASVRIEGKNLQVCDIMAFEVHKSKPQNTSIIFKYNKKQ